MGIEPVVHVVDDDESARDALRKALDSVSIRAQFHESAEEFLKAWDPAIPGCLILDLRLPGISGLELQAALNRSGRNLPIIIATGHGSIFTAVRAMKVGASDYLVKPLNHDVLLQKVRKALEDDKRRLQQQQEQQEIERRLAQLTSRETQVLEGVVQGLSTKAIARRLEISPKTVDLHRSHMMKKMRAQSVAEVVRLYLTTKQGSSM